MPKDEGLLITIIVLRRAAITSIGEVHVACGKIYCGAEGPVQDDPHCGLYDDNTSHPEFDG